MSAFINDLPHGGDEPPMYTPLEHSQPRGLIAKLRTVPRLTYIAHANHMIAISRTICAIFVLLLAMTDTSPPGFHGDFNDVFALAFAVFAFVTLIVSFRAWYLDFTLSGPFIVVDAGALLILMASRTTMIGASVAAALCLLTHILFCSVMRWQLRVATGIALLLNAAWIGNIVLFALPQESMDQSDALRWALVSVLWSLIVMWTSAQLLKTALPRFAGGRTASGLPSATSAMDYAMRTTSASDAVLCWIDQEDSSCRACSSEALENETQPARLGFRAADSFKSLAPMVFDIRRGKAIVWEDGVPSTAHVGSPVPGETLLRELGVESGVCIPADSDEQRGWLILSGIPILGWGHMHLASAVQVEVAQGMAWQSASANELDAALARLRRTVACDLHDSVAHSLAGAKFLLVALQSKVGSSAEVAEEIDSIKEALDAEYVHVRSLIEQLRQMDADANVRNLVEDIETIRPTLASRWQMEIELTDSDFRIQVPVWLSLEIQQIVREAISNAARHGNASAASIKCQKRSGRIEIEVTDNGRGFPDPDTTVPPRSISERLGEFGGSLKVDSNPGSTTLRMSLPLGVVD